MKSLKLILTTVVCLAGFFTAQAQHPDSLLNQEDSILIYTVIDRELMSPGYQLRDDIKLDGFHAYENPRRLELGTAGSPGYSLRFDADRPVGFYAGAMPSILPEHRPLRYHHTTTPYTTGSFFLGSKEEQQFSILHTQNIQPNWNASIEFDRLNAVGFYLRQKVVHSQFRFNTNYRSVDQRYQLFGDFMVGNYNTEENGGLSVDSFFTDNITTNRKVFSTELDNSFSARKHNGVNLVQYLWLGKKLRLDDTLRNDYVEHNGWRLAMHNRYDRSLYRYSDDLTNSSFYDTTFLFLYATYDRSDWVRAKNAFSVEYLGVPSDKATWLIGRAGLEHQYHGFRQNGAKTFRRHLLATAKLGTGVVEKWELTAEGDFILVGDQTGNFSAKAQSRFFMSGFFKYLSLEGEASQRQPDWIYMLQNGNHFQWENSFDDQQSQSLNLHLLTKAFWMKGTVSNVQGYTYFDSIAHPAQKGDALQDSECHRRKTTGVW